MGLKFKDFYKGIRLRALTSDPSDNVNGTMWYNSATNRIKMYLQSAIRTIVTEDQTQTLTGKTIDGDDNTLQDVAISALKTVLADANKFLSRDGAGAVVATKAVPSGAVVGDTDTQTLTGKTIDGDDNTVQDLPVTSIKTVLADASKFFVRDASGIPTTSTKDVPAGAVVGTTDTQVLTGKDIDGGTASNTSRHTLPKNTNANLQALTRKQGTLVYDTSNNQVMFDDGSSLTALTGGGGGGTAIPNSAVSTEAELTSAIAGLTSGGIILIESAFAITSTVTVTAGILLQGRLGYGAITLGTGGELVLANEARMRDVQIDRTKTTGVLVRITGNKTRIDNCKFILNSADDVTAVRVEGSFNKIADSLFSGVIGGSADGIEFFSGSDNFEIDNVFE